MKTVCKKLFCLMLVAMLLVSAVPFAFAAEGDANVLWIEVHHTNGTPLASGKNVPVTVGETYDAAGVIAFAEGLYPEYFSTGYVTVSADSAVITDGVVGARVFVEECTHPASKLTTTNTATCGADGVKTIACQCGVTVSTEEIAATGDHNFVNGVCSVCSASQEVLATITFHYLDSQGNETAAVRTVYTDGQAINPPAVPANPVSGFSYWAENENGTGDTINNDETLIYNSQTPKHFYAIYNKKSAMSELKIYVVRYVDGVRKEAHYLFSEYFTTSNTDNNMYQYLNNHAAEIRTAAVAELGDGYTWETVKFYNYFTDEVLTTANMKDNGDKSVYIKMNSKDTNVAQVLLYIHKGKTETVANILELTGYTAGEKVYLDNVKTALKNNGYSWSSISSLYTDAQWKDLIDGETPSGANVVDITTNGTYKIHVMLNGATYSGTADSSNPKTGDAIIASIGTMASTAATAAYLFLNKKRFVK